MKKYFISLLLALLSFSASAQNMSGPTSVVVGNTYQYSFYNGTVYSSVQFVTGYGTIVSTWNTGATYYATVRWNSPASGTLLALVDNNYVQRGSLSGMTISIGTPVTTFTITRNCGNTNVTADVAPPSGVNWYWQTSASGTSTTLGYASTINRTVADQLYLRARWGTTGAWSSSSLTVTSFTIVSTPPSVPASSADGHAISNLGLVAVPISVASVGSATGYNWYLMPGNTLAGNTSTPNFSPSISTTSTYEVESLIGACASTTRRSVTAYKYPIPVITANNNGIITLGRDVTLSVSNYSYSSYEWREANGTSPLPLPNNTATYDIGTAGKYTVHVTKGNGSGTPAFYTTEGFRVKSGLEGLDMNFIVTNNVSKENVTTTTAVEGLGPEFNRQTIKYFDALGRPLQAVITQSSPTARDVVYPVVYDDYGREFRKYLPFVAEDHGLYKASVIDGSGNYSNAALNFYNNSLDKIADDIKPYSELQLEASSSGKTLSKYGPGSSWYTNNKFIEYQYRINKHGTATGEEKIILWKINSGLPVRNTAINSGFYTSGALSVQITKNEQGNETRVYTNKEGRVILRKIYAAGTMTDLNNRDNWACTYYIYDDYGSLLFVIPPELSRIIMINDTTDPTATQLNNFSYQYTYDGRKRLVSKRSPGALPIYMVYDSRNRVVLTQNGEQRPTSQSRYWSFIKYDDLNRPIATGIKDTAVTLSQIQMQAVVDNFYSKSWTRLGETFVGVATGNIHGYSNRSYPVVFGSPGVLNKDAYLTVTYYDNYDVLSTWYGQYGYVNESVSATANGITYSQPSAPFSRINGHAAGTKVKVLDGGVRGGFTWLKSLIYYDDRFNVLQIVSDNYKGGIDRVTSILDFGGKLLKEKKTHVEQDITWTASSGTIQAGNKLIRSAASNDWTNAGAISTQVLGANQDGWMEVMVSDITANRMVGLADTNPDLGYASIDYALYINGNVLKIYESNVLRYTSANGFISPGDILRIQRTGGTVTYHLNGGAAVRTSNVSSSSALFVDASIYTTSSNIAGVRSSFSLSSNSSVREFEYDHSGRLVKLYHQLNSEPKVLLDLFEYNEIGQLVDKKLHSVNGSIAKQSVDFRYNIRGWLSKMNESNIDIAYSDPSNAGEKRDFFGFELGYNFDTGIGNSSLFDGIISSIKWSKNGSIGTTKENGYLYSYDPMNRLIGASFKEKAASWGNALNSGYSESGYTYDFNGNIKSLTRYDERGSTTAMDALAYDYGSGSTQSNKVLKITDSGDAYRGFLDGSNVTTEYTYNNNGSMIVDLNKGLSEITYNVLELPETVTRGGNTIQYIYDATGRKLSQATAFGNTRRLADYVGEYYYEDDVLRFISHDEGRIAVSKNETIIINRADNSTNYTPTSNVTLSNVAQNGENYVKVTATAGAALNKLGVHPISGAVPVAPGDRFRLRVKGYNNSANTVNIYVKGNSTDLIWPGPRISETSITEMNSEIEFIIPSGVTQITIGLLWSATATAGASDYFMINEIELQKITPISPEYHYDLTDQLGNVRLTFTSKDECVTDLATLEDSNLNAERGRFLRIDEAKRVYHNLFDHTNGSSPGSAQRLNGSTNEKYGLAKSIAVMPGDTIYMEVFAKFVDTNTSNWTGGFTTLMGQVAANTAGVVSDGTGYTTSTTSFPWTGLQNTSGSSGTGPKAYLNWLVFDRSYNFKTAGYVRMGNTAKEYGQNVAHELLSGNFVVAEPGYVYIYLSNEETSPIEVYFDDFKVIQCKSPVLQNEDYYPFGLVFNSNQRENSLTNKLRKFQGQEHTDNIGLNWDFYKYRNHQPDIGRFFTIDPMASAFYYNSPYAFSDNKVTTHRELEGLETFFIHGTGEGNSIWTKDVTDFIMRELKPYVSGDQTVDIGFSWDDYAGGGVNRNWLYNREKRERATAARMLVGYIERNRKEGQEITLVSYSHGGNVAIQAARTLFDKHKIRVKMINFNTPAFNKANDPENPWDNPGIDEMVHFFTEGDNVAGPVAGDEKYGGLAGSNIKQIELKEPIKSDKYGYNEHLFENINWKEVLQKFKSLMDFYDSLGGSEKTESKQEKKPDADEEACKRSGGC